jgi:hypothetical protein
MLTRQSEDGAAFSIGDDEFGNWAADDDDDTYTLSFMGPNLSVDGNKTPKGKHD